ncbi:MAG: flagellar FliJ family protein [Bryobacteraceae bacterium]
MPTFRFRLEKVLQWQEKQRQMEEMRIRKLSQDLEQNKSAFARLQADRVAIEQQVLCGKQVSPADLVALGSFRIRMEKQATDLRQRRDECERQLNERRAEWFEMRRKCRLYEKLKARRQKEFDAEADRESERFATENYLARWTPST